MSRFIVLYRNKSTGEVNVAPKSDLKDLRSVYGYETYEVMDKKFCVSKRMEIQFTEDSLKKYKT